MPDLPIIDFRSDTVTGPTQEMREAMFNAEVGDDVYGDDPTVKKLEELAANKLGKEAALLVPTGNFGNQLALFTHCQRGDEVILGDDCHIVWHETGGAAVIAGVQLRTLASNKGVLKTKDVRRSIRWFDDIHAPKTGLICLENAHSNGRVIPLNAMTEISALAREAKIPVHLDGARIFNAATHLRCDVREISQHVDSVMFCLSKGLAAPIGSMLVGNTEFIKQATRKRKLMGGGMRQAGIFAAPGIVALTKMATRLEEDHLRAMRLAIALDSLTAISIDYDSVQINMVWLKLDSSINVALLMDQLRNAGIKAHPPENGLMRLVTHWQIDDIAIERLLTVFRRVCVA